MREHRRIVDWIEAGRRGIEASECYKRPWPEPASSCELAKAAIQAALPDVEADLRAKYEEEIETARAGTRGRQARIKQLEEEVEKLRREVGRTEKAHTETRERVCLELAEKLEDLSDLPAHQDTMQLRSSVLLDAAALCVRVAKGEER